MRRIQTILFWAGCVLGAAVICPASWAQPDPAVPAPSLLQVLTLRDGSQIKGHLIEVDGDHYVFQSLQLGDIRVRASEVQSITTDRGMCALPAGPSPADPGSLLGPSAANSPFYAQVREIQQQYFSDPKVMASLQELANDPEIVKILSDPQLLQAVFSMNPQQIMNDPQAQQLFQNPKIQSLIQQVGQQMNVSPEPAPQP